MSAWALMALPLLLEQLPRLLDWVRLLGAAFLMFLGIKMLFSKSRDLAPMHLQPEATGLRIMRTFLLGLMTNLLNAKALLFFVAVCTSLLKSDVTAWQRAAMGLWMSAATMLWFSFIALTIGDSRIRGRLSHHANFIDRTTGVLICTLGIVILVELVLGQ